MNKRRTFNILRFIAILAMVLTLFATTFMLIQSSLSGEQSSAVSGAISGDRSKEVVVEAEQKDIPTKKLVLTQAVGYNNEPIKPNITYVPSESTDREIIWSIKDYWYPLNEHKDETLATIDEKGYVTFYHTGSITLVATLKSNPKVTASCAVFSNGPSPKHITSLTPVQKEFYQGEYSNFYLKNQDGNIVRPRDYTISYLHGNIIQLDSFKYEALNIGKETITFAHKDLKEPISFEIEVKKNPNFIPIQKLKGNPKLINENNEYRIKPYTRFSAYDLVSTEPEKAIDTGIFTFTLEQEKGKKILKNNDSDFISQDVGTAKLKITSKIDPSKSVTISIIVYIDPPEAIDIIPSSNIIIVDGLYSLKTFGDNGYYVDDVTYEVIEGRATFTGNKFRAKSLGRLVIRATYNEDPSLYTEIEIDVKLFKTFGQFIRKILGHLLLFSTIGFGFWFVYLFLFKKRWLSYILAIPTGLALAGISEWLQLFAEGRYASWTDVFVDFSGYIIGIIVATIFLLLIFLVAKLLHKFDHLYSTFNLLSYKTIFSKTDKVFSEQKGEDIKNNQEK